MKEYGLPVFPDDRYGRRKKPNHTSALIRVIAKWGGLMAFSARDVFFIIYLSNYPATEEINFPDKHDLKERIEREKEGSENNEEEEYE
jgi:hypothetical protein